MRTERFCLRVKPCVGWFANSKLLQNTSKMKRRKKRRPHRRTRLLFPLRWSCDHVDTILDADDFSESEESDYDLEDSDSDSGPEDRGPVKKQFKSDTAKKGASGSDEKEPKFELGRMRYVTVREFKGRVMVDFREFYDANGEMRPGKKGLALSVEQWNTLKEHMSDIDAAVKKF